MEYGTAIKKVRLLKNLSQAQLAERMGLSKGYLSKIESNTSIPNIEVLEKAAKSFNLPVYLLVLLASNKNDIKNLPDDVLSNLQSSLLELTLNIYDDEN